MHSTSPCNSTTFVCQGLPPQIFSACEVSSDVEEVVDCLIEEVEVLSLSTYCFGICIFDAFCSSFQSLDPQMSPGCGQRGHEVHGTDHPLCVRVHLCSAECTIVLQRRIRSREFCNRVKNSAIEFCRVVGVKASKVKRTTDPAMTELKVWRSSCGTVVPINLLGSRACPLRRRKRSHATASNL